MRDVFLKRLCELAARDERIMLLTGDLGFKVLDEFSSRFKGRFINVGVAEQNMAGIAAGLALEGKTVFIYSIANFPSLRCIEQIRNDVCYHQANVKILSIGSGFSYGQLGMSHHATEDITIMRALPGLRVLSPCEDWETVFCCEYSVAEQGPFHIRIDKASAPSTAKPHEVFRPEKLRRVTDGDDVSIIATGSILGEALAAADILASKGIGLRVYACHSLKPFDSAELFSAVRETQGLLTLEEHTVEGGLGGIVAEILLEEGVIPGFFQRIGLRDKFASVVGAQDYLRGHYGLTASDIVSTIEARFPISNQTRRGTCD